MDQVERTQEALIEAQRVGLNERERETRLRGEIDADDFITGLVVAHRSTAGAGENVEHPEAHPATPGALLTLSGLLGCVDGFASPTSMKIVSSILMTGAAFRVALGRPLGLPLLPGLNWCCRGGLR